MILWSSSCSMRARIGPLSAIVPRNSGPVTTATVTGVSARSVTGEGTARGRGRTRRSARRGGAMRWDNLRARPPACLRRRHRTLGAVDPAATRHCRPEDRFGSTSTRNAATSRGDESQNRVMSANSWAWPTWLRSMVDLHFAGRFWAHSAPTDSLVLRHMTRSGSDTRRSGHALTTSGSVAQASAVTVPESRTWRLGP